MRNLIIILGDQLSDRLSAFEGFDQGADMVWMAEVSGESTKCWSSKQRIALFLSAMRHFAADLESKGIPLHYQRLEDEGERNTFGLALSQLLQQHSPAKVILTRPGEHSVLEEIKQVCNESECELELREDTTFLCSMDEFAVHAKGRKQLRMEYFYREMRRKNQVLMDGNQPQAGKWNFDSSNRQSFGKDGPPNLFKRLRFKPDEITSEVIQLVNSRFADHPGSLDKFNWPVSREQALLALDDFIMNHLSGFGPHQDAMWTGEPFLSHSLIASSLNLKLLHPIEVIEAAESAYGKGAASIESVEGFIRQILGWREYVRGIYWMKMPGYLDKNHLEANNPLPEFYWTGETDMQCQRAVIEQTFEYGYAHHIQRLMVTGLYALLAGVNPKEVHEWYLSVYVDAVEWVELPNTLGMSQFADGGIMASKPYAATGKYISRMSNYCTQCKFNPAKRTGEDACPFTVLYWDFLARNESRLKGNHRMGMQLRNLGNIPEKELAEIRCQAAKLKTKG
ncbi:MAG: cryptochrome/photolyase family protein [Puniceicoccaceae bacterium]